MALWRVRATVDDRPGFLAVLTASLALRSINILAVQVHTTESGAIDDFLVDTPDTMSEPELIAAVERGRGRDAWATRTDPYGLVDPPTHALGMAARLVADPELLSTSLSTLLGGCLIRREPGIAPAGFSADTMRLPDPGSDGMIMLTRLAPVFTPAEFARAQALVEVARAATVRQLGSAVVLLADGTEVTFRQAGPADLAAVSQLHGRCGAQTLLRRYLSGTKGPGDRQLARLLAPARGCTLVAELIVPGEATGHLVAVANLIGEGELAEVALLVQDSWQRRGIGTALLRRLVAIAGPAGFRALTVHTQADNDPMLRTVRRLPQVAQFDHEGPLVSATIAILGLPATV